MDWAVYRAFFSIDIPFLAIRNSLSEERFDSFSIV